MDSISVDQVARWLTFPCDIVALEDWVGNRQGYNSLLAQTPTELAWEQALAIETIRTRKQELLRSQAITGRTLDVDWSSEIGALGKVTCGRPEVLALLIDGWEPVEVLSLGGLAAVVSPVGIVVPNANTGAEVTIDFGLDKPQKMIVPTDEMVLLPIPEGEKVKIKLKLNRDLRLNRKTACSIEVMAGQLGVILDLRGRPMVLPTVDDRGRQRVKKWREAVWGVSK